MTNPSHPDPEKYLRRFRLTEPSPERKAQALAAARRVWAEPVPAALPWRAELGKVAAGLAAALLFVMGVQVFNDRSLAPYTTTNAAAVRQPATPTPVLDGLLGDADVGRYLLAQQWRWQTVAQDHTGYGKVLKERAAILQELYREMGIEAEPVAPDNRAFPKSSGIESALFTTYCINT